MDNLLRQDFLNRTARTLENLIADLRAETDGEIFSEKFRREAFRALHTIKGTARTLGFDHSGELAHELENLLAAANQTASKSTNSLDDDCKTLLAEGLSNLKKTFEKREFEISTAFSERVGAHLAKSAEGEAEKNARIDLRKVPHEIFSQLTNAEKGSLISAVRGEKDIFCLQIIFGLQNFADEFVAFRQSLCEKCEVIATLPAAKETGDAPENSVGFRILLATSSGNDIKETLAESSAEIVFHFAPGAFSNDVSSLLAQIAADGEALAARLGKRAEFEFRADCAQEISSATLKIVFDALTHLVRNAVDHAFEREGKIKINLRDENDGRLRLTIADDGRGIDRKSLKARAIERDLIRADADLTEGETLDLIFAPELSTAPSVSEISGRGVGLDAVKTAVERAGGAISVESEKGSGTTFEILLPLGNCN